MKLTPGPVISLCENYARHSECGVSRRSTRIKRISRRFASRFVVPEITALVRLIDYKNRNRLREEGRTLSEKNSEKNFFTCGTWKNFGLCKFKSRELFSPLVRRATRTLIFFLLFRKREDQLHASRTDRESRHLETPITLRAHAYLSKRFR